jgi:hypothetical protein
MRWLLVLLVACGGGSSKKPTTTTTTTTQPVVAANGCATAYAEYETRWRVARTEDLKEVDFDAESIQQVLEIEVALLPKRTDLDKLRAMYTAIAVFIPDAAWPAALDAADAAISQCGEESPRPG